MGYPAPMNPRDLVTDLLTIALLALYGVQVCPLFEALPGSTVVALLLSAVVLSRAGAILALRQWGKHQPVDERPRFVQRVAFGRAVATGLLLAAMEMLLFGFPVAASFKLLMGVLTLGTLSAMDARFEEELRVIEAVERGDQNLERMGPVPRRTSRATSRCRT